MLSDIKRKTLPAIAKVAGLENPWLTDKTNPAGIGTSIL
jgi:hypothetical protein